MPPKASDTRRPNAGSNGGANNSSTLNADGQPKRKRTRGRGGRGRGGRGKKESSDESSSSDDDSSDDDEDDGAKEPVASTSKIATTSSPAKLKAAALKSVAKGKATEEASTDEDSDDDGSSSDSSSSFLTTSDEDEEVPTPRNARPSQAQQGSIADGSTYAQSQYDTFQGQTQPQSTAAVSKRPDMARPNDPPYIQFGADADATSNIRAFGKPILWGLLPGDIPSTSSPTLNDDENEEHDSRMKVIIEEEKIKSEERYIKFREDYISKMISRFGSSLDQIRIKEGDTMKESRLKVLIDSIALGADTFTSKNGEGIWKVKNGVGEREVVLEGLEMLESKQVEDEQMED